MQTGPSGTGGGCGGGGVKPEAVISKLKDDGDFDRLRVKIIRKLKDNEELRNKIKSLVKESAALNCPGAENMRPRQLSDAIHQEIGEKLMSQISDGVWNIIRSADGMKAEITETVQSVYDRLSNPYEKDNGESSTLMHSQPKSYENGNNGDVSGGGQINGPHSDAEPNEPPGFVLTNPQKKLKKKHVRPPNRKGPPFSNGHAVELEGKEGEKLQTEDFQEPDNLHSAAPPGFSRVLKNKRSGNTSDDDPDVPPGFG